MTFAYVEPPDLQVHTSTIHLLDLVGAQMSADVKMKKRTSQDNIVQRIHMTMGQVSLWTIQRGLQIFLLQKLCHRKGT